MEPVLSGSSASEVTPWQQTKASILQFGLRLLEAIARSVALIVLIFVHRFVDWTLNTAFSPDEWPLNHKLLKGGAFVGFSLVYVMLMIDIGVLFWPFNRKP